MQQITKDILKKALKWFASGETGMSSAFMCSTLCGIDGCQYAHPHDPADINRCFEMLKEIPELRSRMHVMSKTSNEWNQLIQNWDGLQNCLINETGENWERGTRAPITYRAMKGMGL